MRMNASVSGALACAVASPKIGAVVRRIGAQGFRQVFVRDEDTEEATEDATDNAYDEEERDACEDAIADGAGDRSLSRDGEVDAQTERRSNSEDAQRRPGNCIEDGQDEARDLAPQDVCPVEQRQPEQDFAERQKNHTNRHQCLHFCHVLFFCDEMFSDLLDVLLHFMALL